MVIQLYDQDNQDDLRDFLFFQLKIQRSAVQKGRTCERRIEKVISKLSDEQRAQIAVEDIRNAISLYSELEVYNRLINDYE